MNFFIQGKPGIGKSYTIQEVLRDYTAITEGFFVQRLYKKEKLWGFRAQVITNILEPLNAQLDSASKDGIFISPDGKDLSVLEHVILQTEKNSRKPSCRIVLLDEIGGIELLSDTFLSALYRILDSNRLCIGVLKSRENLKHTVRNRNSTNENKDDLYLKRHEKLENRLKRNGSLYTMTDSNKELIRNLLIKYVNT